MERFSLKRLKEVGYKEEYQVKFSKGFSALENLDEDVDINRATKNMRENTKISKSLGFYELKQRKSWFDEGCSKLFDQRKQAEMQWLQDRSQINGDEHASRKLAAYFLLDSC
jgi:hypothetical protein